MKLLIPRAIWQQMCCYAEQALPNEITGVGVIKPITDSDGFVRTFRVTDIRIVPQITSGGYCEFENEALHGVYVDLLEAGRGGDIENLRLRWHSHGDGTVFFSATDTDDIEDNNLNADWMISLVVNTHKKRICRLDYFKPFRFSIKVDVEICDPASAKLIERCRSEIAENLRYFGGSAPSFADKLAGPIRPPRPPRKKGATEAKTGPAENTSTKGGEKDDA